MRKRLNLAAAVSIAAVIAYLSLTTYSGPGGTGSRYAGLAKHLLAYSALTAALSIYFHDTSRGRMDAFITVALYGLFLEIIQNFLPTRYFSFLDIASNTLAASLILLDKNSAIVSRIAETEERMMAATVEKLF